VQSGGILMGETRYIISDAAKMIDVEPHVLRYWEEELGMDIPRNEMGHRYYTDKEVRLFTMVRELKDKGFQLKAIKMVLTALSEESDENEKAVAREEGGQTKDRRNAEKENKSIISLADVRKNYDAETTGGHEDGQKSQNSAKSQDGQRNRGSQEMQGSQRSQETEDSQNDRDGMTGQNEGRQLPASSQKDMPEAVEKSTRPLAPVSAEDKMKHFKYMMDSIMMQALRKNNKSLEEALTDSISDKVIKEMDYLFRVQEEKEEERYKNIDELIRKKQKGRKEAAAAKAPLYGPKKPKRRLF